MMGRQSEESMRVGLEDIDLASCSNVCISCYNCGTFPGMTLVSLLWCGGGGEVSLLISLFSMKISRRKAGQD